MELIDLLREEFGSWFVDQRDQLAEHAVNRYEERPVKRIDMVVVHHSEGVSTWERIAVWHVTDPKHQWPGIGYHFGIEPDGRVSYVGDIGTWRFHAREANSRSVGICCMGDFRRQAPSAEMVAALGRLVVGLETYLGRSLVRWGHRDVVDTECPGDELYRVIADLPAAPASLPPTGSGADVPPVVESVEKARWWTEEGIRRIEAGQAAQARLALQGVVAYLRKLEGV